MPATITTRNSIEHVNSYSDWFLPSKDELAQMRNNLYLYGVGNFPPLNYCTSSEYNATTVYTQNFLDGVQNNLAKEYALGTRASRTFTAGIGAYALRDIGPAGGLIYYINDTTYYEAAPSNFETFRVWSNIDDILIDTTGTAIGTGQANTTAIIGQEGHTDSAAKQCDDLEIVL